MTTRWRVIYTGQLKPGVTADRAISSLTEILGLPRERASALALGGAAKLVGQHLNREPAERLAATLGQAGLIVEIAPMPEPKPALSLEPLAGDSCPKCGTSSSVEQGVCTSCGFVVEQRLVAPPAEPSAPSRQPVARGSAPGRGGRPPSGRPRPEDSGIKLGTVLRVVAGLIVLAVVVGGVVTAPKSDWRRHPAQPTAPAWQRPAAAPNGAAWPSGPDYVAGYPQGNTNGYSQVTLDNERGKSDLFVKLYALGATRPRAVRVFYVPARQSFTLTGVSAARYDFRIRDLTTGGLRRTEPFEIAQSIGSDGGGSYSAFTLRMVAGAGGAALQSWPLAESDF